MTTSLLVLPSLKCLLHPPESHVGSHWYDDIWNRQPNQISCLFPRKRHDGLYFLDLFGLKENKK